MFAFRKCARNYMFTATLTFNNPANNSKTAENFFDILDIVGLSGKISFISDHFWTFKGKHKGTGAVTTCKKAYSTSL